MTAQLVSAVLLFAGAVCFFIVMAELFLAVFVVAP